MNYKYILLFVFVYPMFNSCDIIDGASRSKLSEEDIVKVRDNKSDEGGSNPKLPTFEFVEGYSLDQLFVITERNIAFTWVPTAQSRGVNSGLEYEYKIVPPGTSAENIPFIDLSARNSVNILGLEESFLDTDIYQFIVNVGVIGNDNISDSTFTAQFIVNAIKDKGFVFSPNDVEPNSETGRYNVGIYVDEMVDTDEITAYRLDLLYDQSELSISSNNIDIFTDGRSFFKQDGASLFSFEKILSGNSIDTIRIESGIAGTNLTGNAGSGQIGELSFELLNATTNPSISISPSSFFRLSDGTDITIGIDNLDVAEFIINN